MTTNLPLERQDIIDAGAVLIDGLDFLQTGDYYTRDSHWKASGHRKAAEAIARIITSYRMAGGTNRGIAE